jgi:hypothetical protein
MKRILFIIVVMVAAVLWTAAPPAGAMPVHKHPPVTTTVHNAPVIEVRGDQIPAGLRAQIRSTWYQVHCWVTHPSVDWSILGQKAWTISFQYSWCSATTTPVGPGIFSITAYWLWADVDRTTTHYVYTWAAVAGYRWVGKDDTGTGIFWISYGGSAHGALGVWDQWHVEQCPVRIGVCTDYFPWMHLTVRANATTSLVSGTTF